MKLIISLFLLCFLAALTQAQDIMGNLEGLVTDSSGAPLPGVNISVQSDNLQGIKGTATNEKGYFSIFFLPVDNYKVKISMVGFRELIIEKVLIRLGKTTYFGNLTLSPETINLPEVTVSGDIQFIDPTSTTYGGNINSKDFENLPLERDYRKMAALIPQANTSYFGDEVNLAGGTGNENKYFVDGVEVTDPMFGNTGTNLPYNFIKEIEIRTGGYEAEFRSTLGGIINVVTNSGSDMMHGSVFGFYTNNQLTSKQLSGIGSSESKQNGFANYDFGFGIGGPLYKNNLWYYLAYNPMFINREANVPNFGIYHDKNIINCFAGKLTWHATDRFKLIATITGDPTIRNAVGNVDGFPISLENPDPYLTNEKSGGVNLSLYGTYIHSDEFLFEISYSNVQCSYIVEPATERGKNELLFKDQETGIWSGGVAFRTDELRYVNTLHAAATCIFGVHRFKAGLEYKDNSIYIKEAENNWVSRENDTSYFEYRFNNTDITVHNVIPSLFIQDTWQMFRNFNFNIGFRFEGQFLIGVNEKVDQKIIGPIQPRIGFVFLPAQNGSQKIFGSFGRYIQELSNLFLLLSYSENGYRQYISYDHDPRLNPSDGTYIINEHFKIEEEIDGLQPQYFDEFSLGYEQLINNDLSVKVQGVYRILREAIENMYITDELRYRSGNPGKGEFSDFPVPERDYKAISVAADWHEGKGFNLLTSYVLSRSSGNYPGLFDAYIHNDRPNRSTAFDDLISASENAYGLLPNDVTHIFKIFSSYKFAFNLTVGISFTAQSGTPLSEFAKQPIGIKFLSPRGSVGRTPAMWDLSARFIHELPIMNFVHAKIIIDFFHIASQQQPVDIDQLHYLKVDTNGNPSIPNPTYGQAIRYQPPMSLRLGMEVNF